MGHAPGDARGRWFAAAGALVFAGLLTVVLAQSASAAAGPCSAPVDPRPGIGGLGAPTPGALSTPGSSAGSGTPTGAATSSAPAGSSPATASAPSPPGEASSGSSGSSASSGSSGSGDALAFTGLAAATALGVGVLLVVAGLAVLVGAPSRRSRAGRLWLAILIVGAAASLSVEADRPASASAAPLATPATSDCSAAPANLAESPWGVGLPLAAAVLSGGAIVLTRRRGATRVRTVADGGRWAPMA
jgi:hypothetical protein